MEEAYVLLHSDEDDTRNQLKIVIGGDFKDEIINARRMKENILRGKLLLMHVIRMYVP